MTAAPPATLNLRTAAGRAPNPRCMGVDECGGRVSAIRRGRDHTDLRGGKFGNPGCIVQVNALELAGQSKKEDNFGQKLCLRENIGYKLQIFSKKKQKESSYLGTNTQKTHKIFESAKIEATLQNTKKSV